MSTGQTNRVGQAVPAGDVNQAPAPPPPRTRAEWVSLGIALVLLAGVVGAVVALWLSPNDDPPRFRVEPGAVQRVGDRYQLPVRVRNAGDQTASEVTVEGRVPGGPAEEVAHTTFDFVPGRSTVEGTLIFSRPPEHATVAITSFQKP
jgi:uncharacterized protein (TIGR02588 family)